jgi:outer membrane protein assembly factor BamB
MDWCSSGSRLRARGLVIERRLLQLESACPLRYNPPMARNTRLVALVLTIGLGLLPTAPRAQAPTAPAEWPGWGGPTRDFVSPAKGLAASWPERGPKRLWSRPLGDGHSSIAVDHGRLYTMYRPITGVRNQWKAEEVVVALDATTGRTMWEHRFPTSLETMNFSRGAGPHATPLVVGSRVFAASTDKQFLALDKESGRVLWSHHFVKEYSAPPNQMRWAVMPGYAPSPIAYRDLVIAMSGGKNHGVVAFRQDSGQMVWHAGDFPDDISPASPILIGLDGQDQLVVTSGDGLHGFDPVTGAHLWSHAFPTSSGVNIQTPVWSPADRTLFLSAAYDGGARLLQLTRSGPRTQVKELWFNTRLRVHFTNVVKMADMVVGSSGDFGAAFLVALDSRTGDLLWRDRTFMKAHFIQVDGKVLLLDEDGTLALVTFSRGGMTVLAKTTAATATSWTAPSIVGTRLYLRDRLNILAFDLG